MKKKPVFIAYMILVVLAFGVQTYSWFSSEAKSTNSSFSAGMLRINLDSSMKESGSVLLFNAQGLVPDGTKAEVTTMTVINDGSLDCNIYDTEVNVAYKKGMDVWTGDGSKFMIELTIQHEKQDGTSDTVTLPKSSLPGLEAELDKYFNNKILKAAANGKPYESIKISGGFWLEVDAGESYQGVNVDAKLTFRAKPANL